jgi:hypothetical protein
MVAVILHQGTLEEIDTWHGPGQTVVEHVCGNTSNTLVQAYLYAVAKMPGVPVGFGTDLNGFAGLPGPRLGPEACPGGGPGAGTGVNYPFTAATTRQQMDRCVVGNKTFDINVDGLAHIGMLPDLIADLEVLGLTTDDLAPLLQSADGYVTLWERAWSHGSLTGFQWATQNSKQVYYVDADGHIIELFVTPATPWHATDLTAITGAPQANGRTLFGYEWATQPSKQVYYADTDGHIIELFVTPATPWHATDLTSIT